MTERHTRGPWTHSDDTWVYDRQQSGIAKIGHGVNMNGNARLICAAPELYEAARKVLVSSPGPMLDAAIGCLQRAFAKAQGIEGVEA